MIQVQDQIGYHLNFLTTPKRIVSLVPSLTELLVDLGLENNLVGVTKFCVHPKNIRKQKLIVGGTKTIKIQKIKELQPDIIICNKEENTKDIVGICKQVCNTYVSNICTIDDVFELINHYKIIFSCHKKADELTNDLKKEYNSFSHFISNKVHYNVAYFIWKNPLMVAGNNTFINHLLTINNLNNVFANKERYPKTTIQELKTMDIDILLLSSEPYPFKEKDCLEFNKNSNENKTIIVDGECFSWYGSRLLKAFAYFKKLRVYLESNFPV